MIKVLLADDSPTFRAVLRAILDGPEMRVVGEALDGADAVQKTVALRPDVVTMDVEMPRKDGLRAVAEIMARAPTPVIVVSAGAAGGGQQQLVFRALEAGALEVLEKPRGLKGAGFEQQVAAIRMAVRAAAGVKVVTRHERRTPVPVAVRARPIACVGIAASTGGPAALRRVLAALPPDLAAPVVVVQHIADGFLDGLVTWLGSETRLPVAVARHGERLVAGRVYFAPEGRHVVVTAAGALHFDGRAPVRGFRPSATVLFESLAEELGAAAAGVVLTGMGDDGAKGLLALRQKGGFTVAQDEASSVVWGMPRVAVELGAAELTLPVDGIADALVKVVRGA